MSDKDVVSPEEYSYMTSDSSQLVEWIGDAILKCVKMKDVSQREALMKELLDLKTEADVLRNNVITTTDVAI